MTYYKEANLCEWDPKRQQPAEYTPGVVESYRGCPNQAELMVGAKGQWRLCSNCASLSHFKRFGIRRKIKSKMERTDILKKLGVPCKVCKKLTLMDETKLCDRCWELETRFESLSSQSKKDWLLGKIIGKEQKETVVEIEELTKFKSEAIQLVSDLADYISSAAPDGSVWVEDLAGRCDAFCVSGCHNCG